jgi:hypothetical protein
MFNIKKCAITARQYDSKRGSFVDTHEVASKIPQSIQDFADMVVENAELTDGTLLKKRYGIDLITNKYFIVFVDPDQSPYQYYMYEYNIDKYDTMITTNVGVATVKGAKYERVIVQGEEFRRLKWFNGDEIFVYIDMNRELIILQKNSRIKLE